MTRERAKELLPVLQAYVNGETIQVAAQNKQSWIDLNEVNFEHFDSKYSYRIKPNPREFVVDTSKSFDGVYRAYCLKESPNIVLPGAIRVRQVEG